MPLFSVMFQTEAETLEEAEAAVAQWTVTPGTMLVSLLGSVSSQNMPVSILDGGAVAEGTRGVAPPLPEPPEDAPEPKPEPEPDA